MKERRLNGFLESNREGSGANLWLALSHIMGPLNISEEMAKTSARTNLIIIADGYFPDGGRGSER